MKFLATIALLAFPILASAQIYKCTQPNGKVGAKKGEMDRFIFHPSNPLI